MLRCTVNFSALKINFILLEELILLHGFLYRTPISIDYDQKLLGC